MPPPKCSPPLLCDYARFSAAAAAAFGLELELVETFASHVFGWRVLTAMMPLQITVSIKGQRLASSAFCQNTQVLLPLRVEVIRRLQLSRSLWNKSFQDRPRVALMEASKCVPGGVDGSDEPLGPRRPYGGCAPFFCRIQPLLVQC